MGEMHRLPSARFHLFALQSALRKHFGDPSITVSHYMKSGAVSTRRKKPLRMKHTFHFLEVNRSAQGKPPSLAVLDIRDNPRLTNNVVETGREMFVPEEKHLGKPVAQAILQTIKRIKHAE